MTKVGDRLIAAVKQARSMTPSEWDEMLRAQARSYARAEMAFGSDRDEAEYRAALESGDPERIAEVNRLLKLR